MSVAFIPSSRDIRAVSSRAAFIRARTRNVGPLSSGTSSTAVTPPSSTGA
jgi:hypothetical protein